MLWAADSHVPCLALKLPYGSNWLRTQQSTGHCTIHAAGMSMPCTLRPQNIRALNPTPKPRLTASHVVGRALHALRGEGGARACRLYHARQTKVAQHLGVGGRTGMTRINQRVSRASAVRLTQTIQIAPRMFPQHLDSPLTQTPALSHSFLPPLSPRPGPPIPAANPLFRSSGMP